MTHLYINTTNEMVHSTWYLIICDQILENQPFWQIDWSDIIIHIS